MGSSSLGKLVEVGCIFRCHLLGCGVSENYIGDLVNISFYKWDVQTGLLFVIDKKNHPPYFHLLIAYAWISMQY